MFRPNETVLDSRTAERVIIEQPLSDNEYLVRRVSDMTRVVVSGGGLMREGGEQLHPGVIMKSGAGGEDQKPENSGAGETEVTPEGSDPTDAESESDQVESGAAAGDTADANTPTE